MKDILVYFILICMALITRITEKMAMNMIYGCPRLKTLNFFYRHAGTMLMEHNGTILITPIASAGRGKAMTNIVVVLWFLLTVIMEIKQWKLVSAMQEK